MLKRKYVKRIYVETAYCDKCGSRMDHTGVVLSSWPEKYPYICSNPDCGEQVMFTSHNKPGTLRYEYEDEECIE